MVVSERRGPAGLVATVAGACLVLAVSALGRAATGPSAYTLEDMKVSPTGEGSASVSFTAQWAQDTYPGNAQCRIDVMDETGAVVGSREFNLDSATERAGVDLQVDVTGVPSRAHGSCGATMSDLSGSNYVQAGSASFAAARDRAPSEGPGELIKGWTAVDLPIDSTGGDPGMQNCQLEVSKTDGTVENLGTFGLNAGPGHDVLKVEVPVEVERVEDVGIACTPL